MRHKRLLWLCAVIITVGTGCDNVAFGGVQVELRAPERTAETEVVDGAPVEAVEQTLEPIPLPPLLQVVERLEGSRARIVPVAILDGEDYRALPRLDDFEDAIERFPMGRWDAGTEIPLYAQGMRVGTFIADGTAERDARRCEARPAGGGYIEVRPSAASLDAYVAVTDQGPTARETRNAEPTFVQDGNLQSGALNVAQRLIPLLGVPWPQSIPGVRLDLQPIRLDSVGGFAVSHVFGDRLQVGTPAPRAYSLFILSREGEDRYEPLVSWYQRAEEGKAFPRLLGAHDVRGIGSADAVLEVFGASSRWLAVLGVDGEWEMLYQDGCGQQPGRGAIRSFP